MTIADKQRHIAQYLAKPAATEIVNVEKLLERLARESRESYPPATIDVSATDVAEAVLAPQIELAITELLTNAIEHSDSDSPTVNLRAEMDDAALVIRVSDDGPGIPDEEQAVLGWEEDDLVHGSGIGLWLTYWIVTNTGGALSFEDNDPRGTTVTIRIPQQK